MRASSTPHIRCTQRKPFINFANKSVSLYYLFPSNYYYVFTKEREQIFMIFYYGA